MRLRLALTAAVALSALASVAAAQDMFIHGGTIHTGVDGAAPASVVVVDDGRISWVGTPDRAEVLPDGRTRFRAASLPDGQVIISDEGRTFIDLKGATLFPGFTDGHAHLNGIGQRELTLNLEGSASVAEAMQRLSDWSVANPDGPIIGRGWIETHWPEGRFLTRQDLDAAAPGRIVLLGRADGHAVVASSAALQAAGVDADTVAPDGGEILKDASGQPTGLLVDAAEQLVAGLMPREDEAATRRAYDAGFRVYSRYGWTGIHYMSAPWADVPLLERMAEEGAAPIRVYNSVTPDGAQALFASGPRSVADGRVITRAVKFYADGALGSRGAALFEPYADRPDTTGLMQMGDEIVPVYEAALRSGIQAATHAIGDRGNHSVADWYGRAMEAVPASERPNGDDVRWRIEHAQILRPSDYGWFERLPLVASMQPSHAIGDLHFAPARLGDARLDGAYAWHSLTDRGVIVVGGSDAPVERGDPAIEFYAAVGRRDLSGFQGPDWRPNEAVDRATALKMFTIWPAWASFREDELGTIEVGKRADFTVFDLDLMTVPLADIPKAKAVYTIVDGVVVYDAED